MGVKTLPLNLVRFVEFVLLPAEIRLARIRTVAIRKSQRKAPEANRSMNPRGSLRAQRFPATHLFEPSSLPNRDHSFAKLVSLRLNALCVNGTWRLPARHQHRG